MVELHGPEPGLTSHLQGLKATDCWPSHMMVLMQLKRVILVMRLLTAQATLERFQGKNRAKLPSSSSTNQKHVGLMKTAFFEAERPPGRRVSQRGCSITALWPHCVCTHRLHSAEHINGPDDHRRPEQTSRRPPPSSN